MSENWMDYKVGQEVYIARWGENQAEAEIEKKQYGIRSILSPGRTLSGSGARTVEDIRDRYVFLEKTISEHAIVKGTNKYVEMLGHLGYIQVGEVYESEDAYIAMAKVKSTNCQTKNIDNDHENDATLKTQIDQAFQDGKVLGENTPQAKRAWFEASLRHICVEIQNGTVMGFPYKLLQGLGLATTEQLTEVEVTPSGYGLHWESLDVHLAVPHLVAGIYGTQKWMDKLDQLGD
jgi:hypothetical protein